MRAIILLIVLLTGALALPASAAAPLSVAITANSAAVAPGQSINYTIDVRGSDALGRTASVVFDAPPDMAIWALGTTGEGCIALSAARAQCVGTVSGQGMLMFVSARASRCVRQASHVAHARADDHLNPAADAWLSLTTAPGICTIALPLVTGGDTAPVTPLDPYPAP